MNGTTNGTTGHGSADHRAAERHAAGGHDACQGFCPVCGAVAPCYRNRRESVCS
jgi:hypothetical protein